MANRICITGVGVISPIGIGKEEFLSALKHGKSGIEEIKAFDTGFSRIEKGRDRFLFRPKGFYFPGKIRRVDRGKPVCHCRL